MYILYNFVLLNALSTMASERHDLLCLNILSLLFHGSPSHLHQRELHIVRLYLVSGEGCQFFVFIELPSFALFHTTLTLKASTLMMQAMHQGKLQLLTININYHFYRDIFKKQAVNMQIFSTVFHIGCLVAEVTYSVV